VKIGFVGLGRMGRPMVTNLLKKGFEVTVHNRSRGPVEALAEQGARPASSPREVAQASDLVLTALTNVESCEQVYLAEDGLIPNGRPGQTLIDCSTVGPETTRACYEASKQRGIGFLDGPMSGGPAGATGATLTFMIGGDDDIFERARPVFEALGKNIHHVGPSGTGTVVKLVNQLLVAIHTSAASEALAFAAKAGASPKAVVEVIGSSFGGSAMLNRNGPLIMARDFDGKTSVNLILKDLGLIHDVGRALDTRMLMTAQAEEVFKEARALGNGDLDMSATVLSLERLMGLEVK
jgi:3-hydroxyisobutyrate dehydrogenase/2-hydroxy-3-oxopropionate reductase